MARSYAAEQEGWGLAKRGSKAVAVKIRETGDGVPVGTQRDLAVSWEPKTAARVTFRAWVARLAAASRGPNPRIQDLLDANLARLDREGHRVREVGVQYRRLAGHFANIGAKDLSHDLCRAYAKAAEKAGYAPNTIWNDLNSLRSAVRAAFRTKLLDTPCHEYVWNIAKPKGRERVLTPDEFWRWYDGATSAHIRLFLVIGLLTAQRHQAICELQWRHVNFETGLVDFSAGMRTRRSVEDKGWQKNRAVVAMTDTLRTYLMAAHAVAASGYVIEYQGKRVIECGEGCRAARIAAGLSDDVFPHVLRHTAITWSEEGGVDVDKTAQMSGHKDKRVLEAVYLHRSGQGSRPAVEAVEAKMGGRKLRVVK